MRHIILFNINVLTKLSRQNMDEILLKIASIDNNNNKIDRWAVMNLCVRGIYLFLRVFYWTLNLFRHYGILCCFLFLHFINILILWYFCISVFSQWYFWWVYSSFFHFINILIAWYFCLFSFQSDQYICYAQPLEEIGESFVGMYIEML